MPDVTWYIRRFRRMSVGEVARRTRDAFWRLAWLREGGGRSSDEAPAFESRRFATPFPAPDRVSLPSSAVGRVVNSAGAVLEGEWNVFGTPVAVGPDVDWFVDRRTGRRAPSAEHAFRIPYRDPERVGDVKYIWELSRHHHLTLLAAAFFITEDERYATRISEHLESWWTSNPFLRGIHWTSGIELGMRLIAWSWIRRLLDGWTGAADLFDRNPRFLRQLYDHQRYLVRFLSHGSSANNHLLAEASGLFSASSAFPWFPESRTWQQRAAQVLRREVPRQTFASGLNREMAFAYHGFALELALTAALEGEAAGMPLGPKVWDALGRMLDTLAALLDADGRPPRFGDDDGAIGLLLDAPGWTRWKGLLATGEALVGTPDWWQVPEDAPDLRTAFWSALAPERIPPPVRLPERPRLFEDAGLALLASLTGTPDEIWCLCHHGPLGFLSTAAHGHAHALSVELRCGGTSILADPGTYLYYGPSEWRDYFRSTRAHNTLEVGAQDQSVQQGRFLWTAHARVRLQEVDGLRGEGPAHWSAEHDGYQRLDPPMIHERGVTLLRMERRVEIRDTLHGAGTHPCRLHFHLAPEVSCRLEGRRARLRFPVEGRMEEAELHLPAAFEWASVRGASRPLLGWHSSCFGDLRPTTTLLGEGRLGLGRTVRTTVHLPPARADRA